MKNMNAEEFAKIAKEMSPIVRIDMARCRDLERFVDSHDEEISAERERFLENLDELWAEYMEYLKKFRNVDFSPAKYGEKWDETFLTTLVGMADLEFFDELMEFVLTTTSEKTGEDFALLPPKSVN